MAQRKFYCPYCSEQDRIGMAGPGLGAHQRAKHPGKPYKRLTQKKNPREKKSKDPIFLLEPAERSRGNAAPGYDAEIRLRIVLKIDVEK